MTYADYKRVYVSRDSAYGGDKAGIKIKHALKFETSEAASRYFGGSVATWEKSLTENERLAVEKYSGNYYRVVNNYLRGRYVDSDFKAAELRELKATIENLDSAIEKFVLTDNVKVYRQCDYRMLKLLKNSPEGIFRDEGYFSTSAVLGSVTSKDITLEIEILKGNGRGAFIDSLSVNKGENEFLVARNSEFKILKIIELPEGKLKIELEMAGGGDE